MSSNAATTQSAQIYNLPEQACNGAALTGGETSYGVFSEQQAHRTIYGVVSLKGVQRDTTFTVRVHENGTVTLPLSRSRPDASGR